MKVHFRLAILLSLLGFQSIIINGQSNVDSLKYELHQKEGLSKAKVLNKLINLLKREKPQEALAYARELQPMLIYGNVNDRYNLLQQIGRIYFHIGIYDSALLYHNKCLVLARNMEKPKLISGSYLNISEDYRLMGRKDQAMDMLLAAKKIAERENNEEQIFSINNNIGLSFKSQGKYDEALQYFKEALYDSPRDSTSLLLDNATAYHNIGTTYMEQEMYDSAMGYYSQALKIREQLKDKRGMVSTQNNIGIIYQKTGREKEAIDIFKSLIQKTREIRDLFGYALAYHNLAESYFSLGYIDSAINYNDSAIIFGQRTNSAYAMQELHHSQSKYYESQGNYQEALSHFKKTEAIQDSVFSAEQEKQLEELQTKYETEQKEQELKLSKKQHELANTQRNLLLVVLIGVLLLSATIFYLLRMRIRKNKLLIEKNKDLHEKEKLLSEMELERSRLEREKLSQQLDQKTRELTTHSLNLIQKKKLLEEVQEKIREAKKSADVSTKATLTKISHLVNHSFNIDDDWQRFQHYFDNLHQSFFEDLKSKHPELTANDLRICALLRMNFSTKEAASILSISPGSMKTARYRLRKKLDLKEGADLYNYLLQF